jgi:hypothetical protein
MSYGNKLKVIRNYTKTRIKLRILKKINNSFKNLRNLFIGFLRKKILNGIKILKDSAIEL